MISSGRPSSSSSVLPSLASTCLGKLVPGGSHLLELDPMARRRNPRHVAAFGGVLTVFADFLHTPLPGAAETHDAANGSIALAIFPAGSTPAPVAQPRMEQIGVYEIELPSELERPLRCPC